jgi:hypothetical protein
MGVVREVVTPDRECRLVSLAQPYEGRKRQAPCRLDTSWREGLWKGVVERHLNSYRRVERHLGGEKCRKLGKKGYGPDQRVDRDRNLVIHRSHRSRRMG